MAEGLNTCTLIGNLGADPELRFTQSNAAVLNLRMATSESYKDKDGNKAENVQWHNVVIWGNRAEPLSKILRKGSRICVIGRIETRSYDDKEGVKRTVTDINAQNIVLLDSKRDGDEQSQGGGQRSQGGGNGGGQRPQAQGRPQTQGGQRPQSNGNGQRPANGNAGGRPQTQRQQQPADDFGEGDIGGGNDDDIPF